MLSPFTAVPSTIGFKSGTSLDESPETLSKTRLAVAAAKQGDQQALRYLYVSYSSNVFGYVRSILQDEHEAEDVTQLVFTKLMTAINKYDDRGVPFFAWLLRMARNLAIDHLRARRATPVETLFDPDQSCGADLDRPQTVRDALGTLTEEQREVIILRHVYGLSPAEIAERMGRSEGSIHGLHHRGRRALRDELVRLESSPFTKGSSRHAAT
ncbi:MAG: sigma-70 family RNA polymerase sigma factor [Solirubrobacterales bacterium]|nr:sigma-70 family RNA polymerase sigma factor [Solirubrobacterales bacterium]